MGKVLMEITTSLDGYTTGPEVSSEAPFGRSGDRLHEWMFAGESADDSDRRETDHFSTIGAVIMGRRMADLGIGPWGEEPTFHAPCFVVTHRPAETIVKKGGTSYIFVTEGIEVAMAQARAAAGEQDVMVEGGADIDRQYLNAGLIDEIRLHVAPILLGAGEISRATRTRSRRARGAADPPRPGAVVSWPPAVRRAAVTDQVGDRAVNDTPEATHVRYRVRR